MSRLYWKLIGGGIVAIMVGMFFASWLARGREVQRLADWQASVTQLVGQADESAKALDPNQVPAAIARIRGRLFVAQNTVDSIDLASKKDKEISDKLDLALDKLLASQDVQADGSALAIKALLERKASGDREKDCAAMEADSEAAWNGWRN